ncbi:MAG: penicillin-binding protein activator, partial [Gammaproteobacteria bacterium]|nr:penicillin-binding protein activator [Gammaproteobacteria bacterium]
EIPARGRLFALGFDAWRLQTLLRGNGIAGSVDGLTGQLAQDAARRVHRTLEWARIDDGVPKPLEP